MTEITINEVDGRQTVELPEAYRLESDIVRIRRDGNFLVLEPVEKRTDEWAWLNDLEPFDDDMVEAALNRPGPDEYDRLDCDLRLKD